MKIENKRPKRLYTQGENPMPMQNKRKALEMELQQIIKTDRQANQMIADAGTECRRIEKQTEEDRQAILDDAAEKREQMQQQVQAEQAEALQQRKDEVQGHTRQQIDALRERVAQNKDAWVADITASIVKGD